MGSDYTSSWSLLTYCYNIINYLVGFLKHNPWRKSVPVFKASRFTEIYTDANSRNKPEHNKTNKMTCELSLVLDHSAL